MVEMNVEEGPLQAFPVEGPPQQGFSVEGHLQQGFPVEGPPQQGFPVEGPPQHGSRVEKGSSTKPVEGHSSGIPQACAPTSLDNKIRPGPTFSGDATDSRGRQCSRAEERKRSVLFLLHFVI